MADSKQGCAFPMVNWPAFRMEKYRVNDYPYHAPQFIFGYFYPKLASDPIIFRRFLLADLEFFPSDHLAFLTVSKIVIFSIKTMKTTENVDFRCYHIFSETTSMEYYMKTNFKFSQKTKTVLIRFVNHQKDQILLL